MAKTYTLWMRDELGSEATQTIRNYSNAPTLEEIEDRIEEWVTTGDWDPSGGKVWVEWRLNEDNRVIRRDTLTVAVPLDHEGLIRAAGGKWRCSHRWGQEGKMSANGADIEYHRCAKCSIVRKWSCFPGNLKSDKVEYYVETEESAQ